MATVEVPSVDLLGVLQTLPRIDLLKIDIEGAEALVVPHCVPAFDRIERMFVRCTPPQVKRRPCRVC